MYLLTSSSGTTARAAFQAVAAAEALNQPNEVADPFVRLQRMGSCKETTHDQPTPLTSGEVVVGSRTEPGLQLTDEQWSLISFLFPFEDSQKLSEAFSLLALLLSFVREHNFQVLLTVFVT